MSASPNYDRAVEAARQPPGRSRRFDTPVPATATAVYVKPSSPFTSGNLHMGHVRDYSIGDAYAALPARPRRRGAVRLRLRRLRPAGRDGGDRAQGRPSRLGRALRRADARPDETPRLLLRLRPRLLQLRRGAVPLVAVALRHSARGRDDLPRRRDGRLVRHLPDDARRAAGGGRPLLALPQPGAPDPPPDLVSAHHSIPRGERPSTSTGSRTGTSSRLQTQRYILGTHRRGRGRPAGPRRRHVTVFTPHRRCGRRGALRLALAAPPGGRAVGCASPRSAPARRAALGRLGAQRPRRRRGTGDRHRPRR